MAADEVVLHQFPHSHYNEKARWALAWKGIAHRRVDHLPGPHAFRIRRLTGSTQVPVLCIGDEVVPGSARIIDELERRHPEPPLYPADPGQRVRALALQAHFDAEVGPKVRRALFSVLIHEPGYTCRLFSERRSALVRALYRASFPIARGMMARSMAVLDPRAVAEAFEGARAGLERVAKEAGSSGQLVGDAFGVADLAGAALLAPLVDPDHPEMRLPRPLPAALEAFLGRFAASPGAAWVREQYRRHRPRV